MTTTNQAIKHLTQRQATGAALVNERVTRERVKKLELLVSNLEKRADIATKLSAINSETYSTELDRLNAFVRASFWARLRWLILGR